MLRNQGCEAADAHFGCPRKETLWPDVTREHVLEVAALSGTRRMTGFQGAEWEVPDARGRKRAVSRFIYDDPISKGDVVGRAFHSGAVSREVFSRPPH